MSNTDHTNIAAITTATIALTRASNAFAKAADQFADALHIPPRIFANRNFICATEAQIAKAKANFTIAQKAFANAQANFNAICQ